MADHRVWGILVSLAAAVIALLAISASAMAARPAVTSGPNLIVNGDAEAGDPSGSGYDAVTIPGWQIEGLPTVVRYGQHADGVTGTAGSPRGATSAAAQFPTVATPGPPDRGQQLFVGGAVGSDELTQTDPVAAAASAIDRGGVRFTLDGWLGGNGSDSSQASVMVTFQSANGTVLGGSSIGPVTALDRDFATELLERSTTGIVPSGTRMARVVLTMTDGTASNMPLADSYNNAYADDLSLRISAPIAAPPPPQPPPSRIGRLDHVFVVYMENEGDGDIVGDPGAPYLNSLIDRYGFATDYHGLEHPSDPNYIALLGGQTFGIDDDCALACTVSAHNLLDNVEASHETWKFYEQTMPSPCYKGDAGPDPTVAEGSYYSPDELPWAYFVDIADNPSRCNAHVLPLPQMAHDLASTKTTPNFVWFEADDCDDMEQCGIAAGDEWLSQTVPTIIDSPAFRTQRSAIFITWDEDYNHLGLNQDNEDQRVPMIVIPSPHSGMLMGAVRSSTYYTHYSLLRTIELALGLPTLTDNDRFATPLNDFWPATSPRPAPFACVRPSGRLAGRSLGPVMLGMTRARARSLFARSSTRGRRYMDFFCPAHEGIRAGYPSPKLLRTLSRPERSGVRGRVVLALTANPYYSLRGARPGTRLATVARRLAVGKGFHIGLNWWYLSPNGPGRGVLKVRHGIIEEIGIADKQLTTDRQACRRFLTSFN